MENEKLFEESYVVLRRTPGIATNLPYGEELFLNHRTHRVYRPAYHMRIPYTQAIKRYYVVEFTPRRNMRISNAFNATE